MTKLLERVFSQAEYLSESQQDALASQWLAALEQTELSELEEGRVLALSDYLTELEPDQTAHQHWLETNRTSVRKARFVSGQGLVIERFKNRFLDRYSRFVFHNENQLDTNKQV